MRNILFKLATKNFLSKMIVIGKGWPGVWDELSFYLYIILVIYRARLLAVHHSGMRETLIFDRVDEKF